LTGVPLHHIPALSKESGDKEEMSKDYRLTLEMIESNFERENMFWPKPND